MFVSKRGMEGKWGVAYMLQLLRRQWLYSRGSWLISGLRNLVEQQIVLVVGSSRVQIGYEGERSRPL